MNFGLIGQGAIAGYVADALTARGQSIAAYLVRPERIQDASNRDSHAPVFVSAVEALPKAIDHMIDCAGHEALIAYGPEILRAGVDLTTVSIGALADPDVEKMLGSAAQDGGATLHLATGAIGALDALSAARCGVLKRVRYVGRKPPAGWKGSPAQDKIDLETLSDTPQTHFSGTARQAALLYPKNANVAAAVALAGLGFDNTEVELIADPTVSQNIHEIAAEGDFGSFDFSIRGATLPGNPKTSALAAMSIVHTLDNANRSIRF